MPPPAAPCASRPGPLRVPAARRRRPRTPRLRPGETPDRARRPRHADHQTAERAGATRPASPRLSFASSRCRTSPSLALDVVAPLSRIGFRRIRFLGGAPVGSRRSLRITREVDVVYALGASGLGYAMARRRPEATKPFVFNPQGLEEFGGTNPEHARLKRIAYVPLQSAVRTCARAADSVIATDRALVPTLLAASADRSRADRRGAERDRSPGHRSAAILILVLVRVLVTRGGQLRARAHIPPDAALLVSVGRLEANKGFHVFARALALLQQRQPDLAANLYWVLAGDGPFRAADRACGAGRRGGFAYDHRRPGVRRGAARLVRGGGSVRAPDLVPRQLAGDARSHGPRAARSWRRVPEACRTRSRLTKMAGWSIPTGPINSRTRSPPRFRRRPTSGPRWGGPAAPASNASSPGRSLPRQ